MSPLMVPIQLAEKRRRNALERLEHQETDMRVQPSQLRFLPYPFQYYFTIASDCDGKQTVEYGPLFHAGKMIRETFALPISDSYFVKTLYDKGMRWHPDPDQPKLLSSHFDLLSFLEQNALWIRKFHSGWYDVIHGWVPRLKIKIANSFKFVARPERISLMLEKISAHKRMKRLEFKAPPGWQQFNPPRYFCCSLKMPHLGAYFLLHGYLAKELFFTLSSAEILEGCHFDHKPYVIDLWPFFKNRQWTDVDRLSLVFEFLGPGSLEVKEPCLISDTRLDILNQRSLSESFNIGSTTFTSHGGGVILGARGMHHSRSLDPRCMAERRGNPHYCVDLLREHQIQFLNTYNNTSETKVRPIQELAFTNNLNDGTPIYDFHRYMHQSADGKEFQIDGKPANLSLSDFIGSHIHRALEAMKNPGDGAILYTHAAVRNHVSSGQEETIPENWFNAETCDAFRTIAERYYNFHGNLPVVQRIWIAPTSVLLRYAQVRNEISFHSWYDPEQNVLQIRSWKDAITEKNIPDADNGYRELRGLTFYVTASNWTRVCIDDQEIQFLIRNPADETGRESVTLADCQTPTVLLGAVLPSDNRIEITSSGGILTSPKEKFKGGLEFQLKQEKGKCGWKPPYVVLANTFGLMYSFQKSDKRIRYGLHIKTDNGFELAVEESIKESDAYFCNLEPWEETAPRVVCIPYYLLKTLNPIQPPVYPVGKITDVEIQIEGPEGAIFRLDFLHLWRDSETPVYGGGFIVGGRFTPEKKISNILMKIQNRIFAALQTSNGFYYFQNKVKRGSVVEIYARCDGGGEIEPRNGRYHEILSNQLEIDF